MKHQDLFCIKGGRIPKAVELQFLSQSHFRKMLFRNFIGYKIALHCREANLISKSVALIRVPVWNFNHNKAPLAPPPRLHSRKVQDLFCKDAEASLHKFRLSLAYGLGLAAIHEALPLCPLEVLFSERPHAPTRRVNPRVRTGHPRPSSRPHRRNLKIKRY